MDLGLTGKVAIVTGASRGIGRAIAHCFAAEGCGVAICARGAAALNETAATLALSGTPVHHAAFDVANRDALEQFISATAVRLGRVDILVANASLMLDDDDDTSWQRTFDADLMHAVHASRIAATHIARQGGGAIVLISSISGMAPDGPGPYGPLKAALISHGRQLAEQYADDGIRVNVVAPGSVEFPGGYWDEMRRREPSVYADAVAASALSRHGRPEEVAAAVVFIASPRASLITGTVVRTDGGQWHANH